MKVGMQERRIPVKVAHPFRSRQKVSGQGLITMEFIRTTTRVDERVIVDGEFSPMVMNTADRIVNIIWNTKVQEMHEEVADNINDSFLIYDNLFTHALTLHHSAPDVQEALDYIKRLSKNVTGRRTQTEHWSSCIS